jgi:hypothetical protein
LGLVCRTGTHWGDHGRRKTLRNFFQSEPDLFALGSSSPSAWIHYDKLISRAKSHALENNFFEARVKMVRRRLETACLCPDGCAGAS